MHLGSHGKTLWQMNPTTHHCAACSFFFYDIQTPTMHTECSLKEQDVSVFARHAEEKNEGIKKRKHQMMLMERASWNWFPVHHPQCSRL